ncbi:hypothetical protein U0070_011671, partial [Myodes glareolus]
YRAFITNIPFDVKWQSLKDLVKKKVGEVTKVEHLMDTEGKSRGCAAGRLGSTVFVANLDYKVGWKKLKEVFSMAGVVVRVDILEDKD